MSKLTKTALSLVTGAIMLSGGYGEGAIFVPDHLKKGRAFEQARDLLDDDIVCVARSFIDACQGAQPHRLPDGCQVRTGMVSRVR
ncbi:MAG: hypothetical protein LBJ03_03610 [Holosporales bacterium]|jgi:hypothetical protein|nr:hypothetical protein [Holosporales bacterium]